MIIKNGLICSCEKRPHLEPIQEESEQEDEDEAEKSRTSEDEDESFQIRAGAETEVTGAEEESEEDGDELRVMRLWRRRRSSSQSHGSLPQMQFSSSEQAESENLSPPAQNSDSAALSDEGKQERPRKEKWSISRQLRLKVSFWHNFYLKVSYYTKLTLPVFSNNNL